MEPWQTLDAASEADAGRMLAACCGSTRWVEGMLAQRPFGSRERLLETAHEVWFALGDADWREAFSHHPTIGDRETLRQRFPATAHVSEREQAGVAGAEEDVLDALSKGNRAYERTFGYIFIVCATGKSAGEMLARLRERLDNDPADEIRVAVGEQAKITALRLNNL